MAGEYGMHERKLSKLGELPLASLSFIVIAFLVFFNVQIQFQNELREARKNFSAAIDFATKNPSLEITPRFAQVIKSENATYSTDDTFSFLLENRADNPDLVGATKQEKFNLLVAKAFGNLDLHPTRTLGIVPQQDSLIAYFTYSFVHTGWIHFFVTILLILLLAPQIETLWKPNFFLPLLAVATVLAGVVIKLVQPDLDRAYSGGSSIVSLLTGAVMLRFWLQPAQPFAWLKIFPPLAKTALVSLTLPFWTFGVVWLLYMAILPWAIATGLPSGVEHSAGYAANAVALMLGAGAAFVAKKFALERTPSLSPSSQHKKESRERLDLTALHKLREAGNDEQAFQLLTQETQNGVARRDIVLLFWEMAVERAQAKQAAPALHALIKEEARRGDTARAAKLWLQLARHAPQQQIEPELLVHLFPAIRACDESDEPARLALEHALENPSLSEEVRKKLSALKAQLAPKPPVPSAQTVSHAPPIEKKLPPAPFADDEDRSLFGSSTDLDASNAETHTETLTHEHRDELFARDADLGHEAAPLDAMLGGDTTPKSDTPNTLNDDAKQDDTSGTLEDDYAPPPPPQISSYGQDPVPFELATPKSDERADGASTIQAGRNLDSWLTELGMPPLAPPSAKAKSPIFSHVLIKGTVPVALEKEGLLVQSSNGQPTRLAYARIQAIALAAVAGLTSSGKPILIIDLLLNWRSGSSGALQIVRLRSDQFDPRKLCPQTDSPLQAVFDLVTFLRTKSNATVLVGLEEPGKVPTFASLALYTQQVLGVESQEA